MQNIMPDRNGAYKIGRFDIQQTGAGDWRVSIIDRDGNYDLNEYFSTKAKAFSFAHKNA